MGRLRRDRGGFGWWVPVPSPVRPTAAEHPIDPVLVEALGLIAAKDRPPQRVVEHLGKKLHETLVERLVGEMLLRPQTEKVQGLAGWFHGNWPLVDRNHPAYAAHVLGVRRQLEQTLVLGAEPDERTAALAVILWRLGHPEKVLMVEGWAHRREIREMSKRGRRLIGGNWVDDALSDALARRRS